MMRLFITVLLTVIALNHSCSTARADGGATAAKVIGFVGTAAATVVVEEITRHLINTFPWQEGTTEIGEQIIKSNGDLKDDGKLIIGKTETIIANSRIQRMWYGTIKMKREDHVQLNYVIDLSKVTFDVDHKQGTILVSLPEIEVGPTEITKTSYSESHTRLRKWFSSDTRQALVALLDKDSHRSIKKEATGQLSNVQNKVGRNLIEKSKSPLAVKDYAVKLLFARP